MNELEIRGQELSVRNTSNLDPADGEALSPSLHLDI
jgi:hypothetical protein